jgi:hypothetical protein
MERQQGSGKARAPDWLFVIDLLASLAARFDYLDTWPHQNVWVSSLVTASILRDADRKPCMQPSELACWEIV